MATRRSLDKVSQEPSRMDLSSARIFSSSPSFGELSPSTTASSQLPASSSQTSALTTSISTTSTSQLLSDTLTQRSATHQDGHTAAKTEMFSPSRLQSPEHGQLWSHWSRRDSQRALVSPTSAVPWSSRSSAAQRSSQLSSRSSITHTSPSQLFLSSQRSKELLLPHTPHTVLSHSLS